MSRLGAAITWLGHAGFHITTEPAGPVVLIDPWLDNPRAPAHAAELAAGAQVIVVTHGHMDHTASTVALATQTGATILTTVELAQELVADGAPAAQVVGFNIGGTVEAHGVRATLVQAFHSSSVTGPDGRPREIGTPCGVVLELPDGTVIYNTGDTGVFGDMALIGELYRPSILMLPIGDFYTMGARQAAKAVALVDAPHVIPQHFDTFPGLPGTADAFLAALPEAHRGRVHIPEPGVTLR